MSKKWEILEFTPFAKYLGKLVAKESGFSFKETKSMISVRQIKNYIEFRGEPDEEDENKIYVTDEIVELICEDIHHHMIGFDLTKSAAKGMLDMYWDDEYNTMMFRTPQDGISGYLEGPEDE